MHLRWIRLALLAAGILAVGLYPTSHEAVVAIRRGDQLATAKHYGAALDTYASAAAMCAGCPQPRLRRGEVFLAQERYTEAWQAYLEALHVGGPIPAYLDGLVHLYSAAGEPTMAVRVLERLIARQPRRPNLWVRLAEAALDTGDIDGARAAFTRAQELGVEPVRRQRMDSRLGIACVERDIACATAHLSEAAQGPDAELASSAGRLVVALSAVESGDEPALARAKLGEALLHHGERELAARQFELAIDLAPEYVDAHAYLGHVQSSLGEAERAVHHLKEAIRLEPGYPLSHFLLGMHYVREGQTVTGRDHLLQAHDLDPLDPAICAAVADTYLRAVEANYAAAERWLHAAVDRAPDDARFHLLLAHFYVDSNIDPAIRGVAAAQVAVQLDPQNSEALETLAWAYHLGGKPHAALEPLLRAQELAPGSARIHYRLGDVYRALGQTRDARAAYQQAVDLDPAGPIGDRAREELEQ